MIYSTNIIKKISNPQTKIKLEAKNKIKKFAKFVINSSFPRT